jgi:hypothetical protein
MVLKCNNGSIIIGVQGRAVGQIGQAARTHKTACGEHWNTWINSFNPSQGSLCSYSHSYFYIIEEKRVTYWL